MSTLKYKCDIRYDQSGLVDGAQKKQYREIALRIMEEVCSHPCAAKVTGSCIRQGVKGIDVNLLFTDDVAIRQINLEYRQIDRSTDVLSFPVNDFTYGEGKLLPYNIDAGTRRLQLGDIVVSIPTMRRQAAEYGHSEARECAFLICHGLLHLLGYDHMNETDEAQMFGFADAILDALQYTRADESF